MKEVVDMKKDVLKDIFVFAIYILLYTLCFVFLRDTRIICIMSFLLNGYFIVRILFLSHKREEEYKNLIESLVNTILVVGDYDFSIDDELGKEFLKEILKLVEK